MESSLEDSPEMERVEKKELTPEEIRRKRLAMKVQKMKLEKSLHSKRSNTSSSLTMAAVYELRLKKLRKNNKGLAKALTEQKIVTQQRYDEVISLQAELQDANERLLRSNDRNFDAIVEQEVDHRFKELGDTLNQAISQAMENLLVVVESFSKVKQLANMRSSSISRISSSSSTSFSFPRPLASRTPLGSNGNNSSPRQSVRPMVSGHVLQPAMVAVQKLDDIWKARVKERFQARQDTLDMSTIGETSNIVANEPTAEESDSVVEADNNLSQSSNEIPSDSTTAETPPPANNPKSPERSPQLRRSGRKTRSPKKFDESPQKCENKKTGSPASQELTSKPNHKRNEKVDSPVLEHIEDPLEGPSWWYADSPSNRGRGRGRARSRGGKRGRPKSSSRPRVICHADVSLEASSDSEEEDSSRKKKRTTPHTSIVINDGEETTTSRSPKSPKPVLDRSYLSSPKTMLTKLEALEAKGGRRSKAKSKGRSLRVSGIGSETEKKLHERNLTQESDSSFTLALSDSACEKGNQSPVANREPETHEHSKIRNNQNNFLFKDADATCIADESMDMTEPISRLLSRVEESKEPREDPVRNAKRFFKRKETKEGSQVEKTHSPQKTPFDLSLMEATYMPIPHYSSQKCIEKENMPPESTGNDNINKDPDEDNVSLRKVSIILKDFMKSPFVESAETTMVEGEFLPKDLQRSPVEAEAVSENGRKRNSRNRKPATMSLVDLGSESNDDDDSWLPDASTKRRSQKPRKPSISKHNTYAERDVNDTRNLKRRNKSECDIALKPSKTRLKNKGRGGGERHSVAATSVFDEEQKTDREDMNLNDCFVKICRTPLKELPRISLPDEEISLLLTKKPDFGLIEKLNLASSTTSQDEDLSPDSNVNNDLDSTKVFFEKLGMLDAVQNPSDQVVPEQLPDEEIVETSTLVSSEVTNSNREVTVGEETGTHSNTIAMSKVLERKEESDPIVVANEIEEAPRKRRSAMKITSFKEPKLGTKMRRPSECDNSGFAKPKPPRKSGRKVKSS